MLDRSRGARRLAATIRALVLLCVAFPLLAAPNWGTVNRGVVKVEAVRKPASDTGVGIVIAASSDSIRILTAAHVVADATAWRVYFYADRAVAYTATVLPRSSDGLDLAVLEVRPQGRALPGNLPRLAVRDRDTLAVDERVWTVDSDWIHIPNTVVRLDHDSDTRLFEYTKVAVDDGFSGGPVFDDDGRLVGVHRGGVAGGRYAFAARLDSAIDALAALGHNTPNLVWGGTDRPGTNVVSPAPVPAPRPGETRVNARDGLTYVWIPAGSFTMGCSPGDTECYPDEEPPHVVSITKGFWIGQTEVTQEAYQKITGRNPSSETAGGKLPVSLGWTDALSYCRAAAMRLPTEAEWEYAARAGSKQSRYGSLDQIAWSDSMGRGEGPRGIHEVGQKQPNAWGLFDTLGNAWEWVADWYADKYPAGYQIDPQGPTSGEVRTLRGGGSYDGAPDRVRVSYRLRGVEGYQRYVSFGVRCVGELP